ncbi:glutamate-1-semialdehyde 2,1-aminomutase [Laribacter hongkongensis]|uniref:glutamate-1-semialdehyde 2,1-aminomutase n=1 Tax=Laribacter hongkongensis TaxID=168471 RepID=UPI001EFC474B|nr:glutamate-1-semialdehyde 2,1-aminomutase [Laribacter hongkongensis]MCG8995490.1 glutamate-1-semialdehyde 2,1-aminomutase [Laribacter hongkongensis]MCG9010307.1 glutamate-1-semialdehyde 2,1-aminomutase [Laribacter hongkongensis]MCG9046201.1 glutamate-1-semialdehyde 2,1-aminomutase [Laribacter hongkongensis]MCG9073773.1 glutamate-1-semialdehyde 2,1-aminomutase [Laribacter hongkongensis]
MSDYQERLLKAIPGGAHTYSRGFDQYPVNAPQILAGGKGAYVFDPEGKRYLDYGMALRAVNIGYAEEEIDRAAIAQIQLGNNLTRPSMIELEAAELLVEMIDSVEMVKFTKNGSTSVSAAVKLARAFTGRELVLRCAEHPFFSYDDWFIGSTPITRGIPRETLEKTKLFKYNDVASLKTLFEQHPGQVACVVLEAETTEKPVDDFLQKVQALCRQHGAVFVLDEMITGFRWHMKGAQHVYGLQPDLCTFGKAMANGFSVSCIAGRREIMELGSIEFEGRERLFLLSSTHGAEMSGLGAFVATMRMMQREKVVEHLWSYGQSLRDLIAGKAEEHGVSHSLKVGGPVCSPWYATFDLARQASLSLRTLFSQEMIRNGVLMPWIALSMRHGEDELRLTADALDRALPVYRKALEEGVDKYLVGPAIKPVFRKFN